MLATWNFIAGNFVDAVLICIAAVLGLLSLGSLLAAWASVRDETQSRRRLELNSATRTTIASMEAWHPENAQITELKRESEDDWNNLLMLKHKAFRQASKYAKYAAAYAIAFVFALGIQSWHMDCEIWQHDPAVSAGSIVKAEELPSGSIRKTVYDEGCSASYEFICEAGSEEQEGKCLKGRKDLILPPPIVTAMEILLFLWMLGIRFLSRAML